jgi:phosphoserine phosphatase RsbU/P
MRLRTAILVTVALLVAGVVGAALLALGGTVTRGARDAVTAELDRAARAVVPVLAERARVRAVEARVTTTQPRLLALMATDAATIQDTADEFRQTLAADVLYVTDAEGRVLGQAARSGAPLPELDDLLVRRAMAGQRGAADAIWSAPAAGGAGPVDYEVHVERLVQGERVLGALVVGHVLGDGAAGEVSQLLGGRPLEVRDGGRVVGAAGLDPAQRAAIAAAAGGRVRVAGTTWRLVRTPWPGGGHLDVTVVADLDRALAPADRLQRLLYIVGGGALVVALVLAVLLGAALSRPVERLVGFTEKIAAGDLAARADVRGVRELRQLAERMNRMAGQLDAGRRALADKQRLEDELAIAARIQTSILPRSFDVPVLDVAARMEPASEVGGDYYDVIPVAGGAWIGIGDVAGHGLDAGLFALMAQTAIAAAVDARPDGAPRELFAAVNRILFANAWGRLGDPRHMTLSLVRVHDDGRLVFAGAHLDLIVIRAGGAAETVKTPGTWVGLVDDVEAVTVDGELRLAAGDTLVLYSDGVLEAADAGGAEFGLPRLVDAARAAAPDGPDRIVAAVVEAVAAHRAAQEDDVTVVALRYRGAA